MVVEEVVTRYSVRRTVFVWVIILAALFLFSICINIMGTGLNPFTVSLHNIFSFMYWHMRAFFNPHSAAAAQHISEMNAVEGVVALHRSVTTLMVGMALAVPGVGFQAFFRNQIASPSVLGVTNACGAGMALVLYISGSLTVITSSIIWGSFGMGLVSVVLVIGITILVSRGQIRADTLLLIGIIISAFFSAVYISVFAKMQSSQMSLMSTKMLGSIGDGISGRFLVYFLIALAVGIIPFWMFRYRVNILSFGKDQARALGVNTNILGIIILLTGTFMEATMIAFFGVIGWVGLVVPHISRFFVGGDIRRVLPMSMLVGAVLVLGANDIAQFLHAPVGLLISMIGTPFFLYLLFKNRGVNI